MNQATKYLDWRLTRQWLFVLAALLYVNINSAGVEARRGFIYDCSYDGPGDQSNHCTGYTQGIPNTLCAQFLNDARSACCGYSGTGVSQCSGDQMCVYCSVPAGTCECNRYGGSCTVVP